MKKTLFLSLFLALGFTSFAQFTDLEFVEIDNGDVLDVPTYRLYANVEGGEIGSVFGDPDNPLLIESTEPFIQVDAFGSVSTNIIDATHFAYLASGTATDDYEYDSWVTIGYENPTDVITAVAWDFSDFETGGAISNDNNAWSVTYGTADSQPDGDGKILLGQFTTAGIISGTISIQGKDTGGVTYNEYSIPLPAMPGVIGCSDPTASNYDPAVTIDNGSCIVDGNADVEFVFENTGTNNTVLIHNPDLNVGGVDAGAGDLLGAFFVNDEGNLQCAGYSEWSDADFTVAAFGSEPGMDNGFQNNEAFTWIIERSLDGEQFYLDPTYDLNDPYITVYQTSSFVKIDAFNTILDPSIPGCTDDTAINYAVVATVDDGSCIYDVEGCTDDTAINYNADATIDDGSCFFEIINGCTDENATNYNAAATVDNGSCTYEGLVFDFVNTGNNCSIVVEDPALEIGGAPAAIGDLIGVFYTNDDGDLVCAGYSVYDGTVPFAVTAWGVETPATENDNGFADNEEFTWIAQITATGETYGILPVYDTESPYITVYQTNGLVRVLEFDSNSAEIIPGCTDPLATNFDPLANLDDLSCTYEVIWEFDNTGNNATVLISTDEISVGGVPIQVGDNIGAFFINDEGELQNAGFEPWPGEIPFSIAVWGTESADTDNGFAEGESLTWLVESTITGEIYEIIPTYDTEAPFIEVYQTNGLLNIISFDGLPVDEIPGCTNEVALNYDPVATLDDGSCIYNLCSFLTVGGSEISQNVDGDPVVAITLSYTHPDATDLPATDITMDFTGIDFTVDAGPVSTGVQTSGTDFIIEYLITGDISGLGETTTLSGVLTVADPDEDCTLDFTEEVTTDHLGCTDATAFNYDADATVDDGTCIPVIEGCTDADAVNYDATANVDNGSCLFSACYTLDVTNISISQIVAGSPVVAIELTNTGDVDIVNGLYGLDVVFSDLTIDGTPIFVNNIAALGGTTTLEFPITSSVADLPATVNLEGAVTVDVAGDLQDCELDILIDIPTDNIGCTDPDAINFSADFTVDDGSCIYPLEFEIIETLPLCNGDAGSIELIITGGVEEYEINLFGADLDEMYAGNYAFTVTDQSGQFLEINYTMVEPDGFVAQISQTSSTPITLTVTSVGGVFYQWLYNGVIIPGANDSQYFPGPIGEYSCYIEDANGCHDYSNIILTAQVGLTDLIGVDGLNIYPNPSDEFVTIEMNTLSEMDMTIQIINLNGQTIVNDELIDQNGQVLRQYEMSQIPSGVYLISIQTEYSSVIKRLIVKH